MHKWATSWLTILKFNSSYTEVQEWARKWRQAFEMDRKGELQEATGKCGVSFQNGQAKTHCDSLHISTKKVGHVHPFKGVCVYGPGGSVHTPLIYIYTYYMLFSYQTGYIMWHSRLRIYIPWGAAEGNIHRKPGMSHYIPCLIAE